MNKNILAVGVACLMTVGLAGCGTSADEPVTRASTPVATQEATPLKTSEPIVTVSGSSGILADEDETQTGEDASSAPQGVSGDVAVSSPAVEDEDDAPSAPVASPAPVATKRTPAPVSPAPTSTATAPASRVQVAPGTVAQPAPSRAVDAPQPASSPAVPSAPVASPAPVVSKTAPEQVYERSFGYDPTGTGGQVLVTYRAVVAPSGLVTCSYGGSSFTPDGQTDWTAYAVVATVSACEAAYVAL
jgi:hypothetical protein